MRTFTAFQDEPYARGNCCWVCGGENHRGLHIKSHWDGDESVCTWMPGASTPSVVFAPSLGF